LRPLASDRSQTAKAARAVARNGFAWLDALFRTGRRFGVYRRHGLTLLLDRSNLIDRRLIYWPVFPGGWEGAQKTYLEAQSRRLASLSLGPMRFLDVGAHWGYYSLLAQRWGLFAKIDAYEPDPINHAQLQAQLFLNDAVARIDTYQLAISEAAGELPWKLSSAHPQGNRGGVGTDDLGTLSVTAAALDARVEPAGEVLVIKIDVEGHECEALRGARRLLGQSQGLLQVESYHFADEVDALMRDLGYTQIHRIKADYYYTNVAALRVAAKA
jgi:FkbM family methyltransferase